MALIFKGISLSRSSVVWSF